MWGQFFLIEFVQKNSRRNQASPGIAARRNGHLNLLPFFSIFQLHIFVGHVRVQQSTVAFQDEGKTVVFEVDDVVLIQLLQAVLGDFDRAKVCVKNGVVVRVFRIIRSEREHAAVRSAAAVDGAHVQREFLGHPQFFQSLYGIFCECQFHFKSPLAFNYRA